MEQIFLTIMLQVQNFLVENLYKQHMALHHWEMGEKKVQLQVATLASVQIL